MSSAFGKPRWERSHGGEQWRLRGQAGQAVELEAYEKKAGEGACLGRGG